MQTLHKPCRFIRYTSLLVCGALVPLLSSCAQQAGPLPPAPLETAPITQNYLIGPEDVLEVMVWKNEDLTRVVRVRPDGKISLPLLGDLHAADLTATQLQEEIGARLSQYYKEPPQVSVLVQEVNSYAIYLLGEVRNPGRYVVKTGTTFLQAVTLAGGFSEFAATNRIIVRRQNPENHGEMAMHLRYKDIIGGLQDNVLLQPGDTIIIP
jgi:polysaccharide biosynthesis/export protein